MLKIALGATFALLQATAVMAQDTVTWKTDIEGWNVAIDRTIDNSCFIISGFEDDLFLRFQFNSTQQNVQLIVASVHWASLENGHDYDVQVAFDDLDAWSGVAKGHRWNDILPSLVLSVPMEDQQASHFMQEFTATGSVSISHEGSEIARLALSGAAEAVAAMLDCQAAMSKAKEAKRAANDPFLPKGDNI